MTANNKKHAANNKNNQRTNTLTTAVRVPLRIQSIEPDWNQPNSPPTLQHLQFGIQTFHVHFAGPSQGRQLLSLCWSSAGRKGVWRRSGHHGGWIEVNFQSSNEILCKILKKRCTWVQADEFRALFVGGFPFTHLQLSSKVGWRYYKIIHLLVEHMCVCVCLCALFFPFPYSATSKEWPQKDLALNFSSSTFSFFQDSRCFISCFTTKCLRSRTGKEGFDGIIDWWFTHVDPLGQNMLKQQTAKTWNKLIQLKLITTCYFSFKVVSELHQQISSREGSVPSNHTSLMRLWDACVGSAKGLSTAKTPPLTTELSSPFVVVPVTLYPLDVIWQGEKNTSALL